ncbi:MAG: sugar transferase [bacterium]
MHNTNSRPKNNRCFLCQIAFNLIIYIISFPLIHLIYRQHLFIEEKYFSFFEIYLFSWAISSLLSRKFRHKEGESYFISARPYFISFFLMIGLLAISINWFDYTFSRILVSGSLIIAFAIELLVLRIVSKIKITLVDIKGLIHSKSSFVIELLSFSWILFFTMFAKMDLAKPVEFYIILVLGSYIIWFISSILTHNFTNFNFVKSYYEIFWNYLASYVIILSLVSFFLFLLDIKTSNKITYISGMMIYSFWSLGIFSLRYLYKTPKETDEISPSLFNAPVLEYGDDNNKEIEKKIKSIIQYSFTQFVETNELLREKFNNVYFKTFPNIFNFLESSLLLSKFDIAHTIVLRSADPYNVEILPNDSLQMFVNLHELNDIRRLTVYFNEINNKLQTGGVFVGKLEPLKYRRIRFLQKYPFFIAKLFYFMDFIWRRVSPKLPVIKKVYFTLTKGKDRALSMAECFGRLYYCGFEIINTHEENNFTYFIVNKVKKPSDDQNASYGLLFKMKRVGKAGKEIFVYKLRTMHPYSEYLQKYMFENYGSSSGDKVDNDFRITYWGKIMRKIWLDEFPMFINFFKGELKLVGVRPLSFHKFEMYPKWLQEKRIKTKPGLVPPYYAHMPNNFEELLESENKYLDEYFEKPILTDIKYFFKAFYNIIFKKARSA